MAAPEYILAAKQANRKPVCYMQIEQADSQVSYYTTKAQWDNPASAARVDTEGEVGSLIGQYYRPFINGAAGTLLFDDINNAADVLSFGEDLSLVNVAVGFTAGVSASATLPGPVTFRMTHRLKFNIGGVISYSDSINDSYTGAGVSTGFEQASVTHTISQKYTLPALLDIGAADSIIITFDVVSIDSIDTPGAGPGILQTIDDTDIETVSTTLLAIPKTGTDCTLTTATMSFPVDPSGTIVFSVDDITETGATIAYSVFGGNTDPPTNDLGVVVDGDELTLYDFYRVTIEFSSTTGGTGKVREIQLVEGLFRYYGTHIDTPFAGVAPYIKENSVSTLNQKIKIGQGLSTVGESSVQLLWTDDVSDLIASGYLKGKDVAIYSGFVGLATEAFEPILTGTWYDHTLDEVNRVITVKIRDAFKQFEKREIPQEIVDPVDGSIDTPTLTYTTESLITVMKDIFDQIGLRDRYISPDFDTLEAGDYSATKYNVSRTMLKPEDSFKLLDQLAVTGSLYLIPLGNGQIMPKPFDINAEHTEELDAFEIDFTNLKGNIKEFFSRFYAYYNPKTTLTSDPSKSDDYDNGTAVIDATAEARWFPEKGVKNHLDLWLTGRTSAATPLTVPPQALTDLMTLWNALFTDPLYTVTAKNVPPRYIDISPADVIQVNNLHLPVVSEVWVIGTTYDEGDRVIHDGEMWRSRVGSNTGNDPVTEAAFWQDMQITDEGLTIGKHFFVLGRKLNPNTALIELDLMEMPPGTIGAFSSAYSTAFDV